MFTLRTGEGGDEMALRLVAEVLPHRWSAELTGNELVIYAQGRLRSRKLWALMSTVSQALDPLLAKPQQTSDSAKRQRHGIHPAIER